MTDSEPTTNQDRSMEAVDRMSALEKATLVTGAGFWSTAEIPAAGVPSITMSDGPHGLRVQRGEQDHLGILEGEPATCFPPAVALASTWDPALVREVGRAIAREAKAQQVSIVLGPGVNVKRSIRGGRNFEYFSEDPLLSGRLGSAWVDGAQGEGVGASVKHFAANSQETERLRVSMDLDERTLREIELRPFQEVVTRSRPATVMCAYNAINGVGSAEHRWLLTDVLRGEWCFDGVVVSDWGAVKDRVESLRAGLDLEMPGTHGRSTAHVVAALEDGSLDPAVVDTAARRVVRLAQRSAAALDADATVDLDDHHRIARSVAAASIILLKNDDAVLPMSATGRIAVIGEFARTPRFQGSGSSVIVPTRLDSALEAITLAAPTAEIRFAAGFTLDGDGRDSALASEAIAAASDADQVVVFLGLPPDSESEGFDRAHIDLPAGQLDLLAAVLEVNPRTIVVLSNGSAVRLAGTVDRAAGILEATLLGQAGGGATADVLFGTVNPSGRLAETIPVRIEDTPDFLSFPGEALHAPWTEGVFVGYRWYDARDIEVSFPFGHGLSYTTFRWSSLAVERRDSGLTVSLDVENTGGRDGHEIVQVYTALPSSAFRRAPRELRAFSKVWIPRGERRRVELEVRDDDLAVWSVRHGRFVVEGGEWEVIAAASSRDVRLTTSVAIEGDATALPLTLDSTVEEWLAHPIAGAQVAAALAEISGERDDVFFAMIAQTPVRNAAMLDGGDALIERLQAMIALMG